jgi:gluconolactonase
MKFSPLLPIILTLTALPGFSQPQDGPVRPTIGTVVRLSPEFNELVPQGAVIEVLASGFDWTEGPVWVPAADEKESGSLLFSEIPSNSVRQWKESADGVSIFLQPSGYSGPGKYSAEPGCNGLALDADGRLVSCEHGDRRLSVLTKGGGKRTLADNWEGKRFNSPNDLTIRRNGDIYFTDPIYGLPSQEKDPSREIDFCGVYRWSKATGQVTLITQALERPNGIAFSPDEKTLYVAQSSAKAAIWMAFPVNEDGTVGAGVVFKDVTAMVATNGFKGLPDGMKVDSAGHIWATGPGGIHVMDASGKLLGRIDPKQNTSNCAFGPGYLYFTADMYVCRIAITAKEAKEPQKPE